MKEITVQSICGKNIYIFEDHATALIPWAEYRRHLDYAPNLFTLDFHTDTITAFNFYQCQQEFDNPNLIPGENSARLCAAIDFRDAVSIERAVEDLRNDEQIDTAIKAGILDYAFVVSYYGHGMTDSDAAPQKRFNVDMSEKQSDGMITLTCTEIEDSPDETVENTDLKIPDDKMIIIDCELGFEYQNINISEEEIRQHSDLAIESEYLNAKLKVVNEICRAIGQPDFMKGNYILDIDLDYFRTERSVAPKDTQTFYELIRNAQVITIAMEPYFVVQERLNGETITSDFLLPRLLEHIRKALT